MRSVEAHAAFTPLKSQCGVVMLVSLLVLVAVTLLGIFAMRGVILNEAIAGNTMDKQRAFQAAESALRYGEWWLAGQNLGPHAACTNAAPVNGNQVGLMRVCTQPLSAPEQLPWTGAISYKPRSMRLATANTSRNWTHDGSQDILYAEAPLLHISLLTPVSDLKLAHGSRFYAVHASAKGGQTKSVSILKSVVAVRPNSIDLGDL